MNLYTSESPINTVKQKNHHSASCRMVKNALTTVLQPAKTWLTRLPGFCKLQKGVLCVEQASAGCGRVVDAFISQLHACNYPVYALSKQLYACKRVVDRKSWQLYEKNGDLSRRVALCIIGAKGLAVSRK